MIDQEPPKWPIRILKLLIRAIYLEEIQGDMEERYQDNLSEFGKSKARRLFLIDSLKLIRPSLLKRPVGHYQLNYHGMLRHQLRIAWRQMLNQKIFSVIKIGGFAIGVAACILIVRYVTHQMSYDSHYANEERIFRLVNQWSDSEETGLWSNVHGPLKEILEDNIPEMEKVARVVLWDWGDGGDNQIRRVDSDYNSYEEGFIYADPELLEILETPMVYGSQENALAVPNSIVISERMAQRYFPDENPVGEQIILNDDKESTYTVGGVIKDFPTNSHLKADFIMTLFGRDKGPGASGWCCTNYAMYVQLTANADKLAVQEKTVDIRNSMVLDKLKESGAAGIEEMRQYQSYYLQSVTDIYLNPEQVGDNVSHGSIELLGIFNLIAVIILLLACINFVNLTTANAVNRAKEVGIRKVVGSFKSHLITQYLLESCVMTLVAVLLGTLLATLALPAFNEFIGVSLTIPWLSYWFIPMLLATSLVIGFLSGLYPAFYLSAFRPIEVLKGKITSLGKTSILRSGMIVFQFAATFILIASTLVVYQQFEFIMNKSTGFDKEQVVNIMGLETMQPSERKVFKSELKKLPQVINATNSDFLPVDGGAIQNRSFWHAQRKQDEAGFEAAYWWVDADYISTMGMELLEGRNFREAGEEQSIIINESALGALRLPNPLGEQVIDMFDEKYTIIGVVKDFYFESLFGEVRPLVMVSGYGKSTISVKVNAVNMANAIASMEALYESVQSNQALRYQFMDERYAAMYRDFNRAKVLFILFSLLSIVIACSGLFAMSVHMIGRRSKEISIRKVLGASANKVFWLLSFDFIKLVLVAIVLGIPVASYFMDFILEDFAYRIDISWSYFGSAGLAAFLIALFTVSFQAVRAAIVNPVRFLKSE